MAEETTDKSIVVWYPRLTYFIPDVSETYFIPDVSELTSLCLFHDQVVVCLYPTLLRELIEYWKVDSYLLRERSTFQDILVTLAHEKVVKLLTARDLCEIDAPSLPKQLERYRLETSKVYWEFFELVAKEGFVEKTKAEKSIKTITNFFETVYSYRISKARGYPLVSDDKSLQAGINNIKSVDNIRWILGKSAICQLALPDVKAVHVEDILEARNELKDELLEFRAGILKLTWLLHQQVQNKNDMKQIRQEANTLVNTVIKGSLLSLENRMKQHKKKRIRRMLFGTGKVLVEATKLFLPSGAVEKMISGGKTIFQLATEIDSAKLPEDQVATYLYKLKGKLKT